MELKEYEITASVKIAAYNASDSAIHHIITSAIAEALRKESERAYFIIGGDVAVAMKDVSSR